MEQPQFGDPTNNKKSPSGATSGNYVPKHGTGQAVKTCIALNWRYQAITRFDLSMSEIEMLRQQPNSKI
jgi:hypothetical protein